MVFEVRVGLVRVCLRDVRMFDVPNVVVKVEDMIRLICASGDRVWGVSGQETAVKGPSPCRRG